MKRFSILWYDHLGTEPEEIIEAENMLEAIKKSYEKYNGKPPRQLQTVKEIR